MRISYVRIHIALTVLVTALFVALVITEPSAGNIVFAVVAVQVYWFLSPIANMLRRERKETR